MKRTFRKFTEHNDWEGEKWHAFLQVEGNEGAIFELEKVLSHLSEDIGFVLHEGRYDEKTVDTLVEHGDSGYMSQFNKLTGKFTLCDMDEPCTQFADEFYKMGIRDMFS